MDSTSFKGFPGESVDFFRTLSANNTKPWFAEHKSEYDKYVMQPAREFVVEMGNLLYKDFPGIHAIPKVDKSIFRIFRDVRFSKDKTPYKTHLGIWMWEGEAKRMECSGFYFHIEPGNFLLGSGIYIFPRHILSAYRDAVVDDRYGPALREAISEVEAHKDIRVGGTHYKKTPRGYDKDHPNADLLLYNGITAFYESDIPDIVFTPDIIGYCLDMYKKMAPLHLWLRELTERL